MQEDGLQAMNHRQNLSIWAERVQACRNSGLSVREWCRENGVTEGSFYRWQRKLYSEYSSHQHFVEVSPAGQSSTSAAAVLSVGGLRVEIQTGADEETIRALLRALKSC